MNKVVDSKVGVVKSVAGTIPEIGQVSDRDRLAILISVCTPCTAPGWRNGQKALCGRAQCKGTSTHFASVCPVMLAARRERDQIWEKLLQQKRSKLAENRSESSEATTASTCPSTRVTTGGPRLTPAELAQKVTENKPDS